MLTPSFELSQDDIYLIIVVKARYAKVTEAEIFIDGNLFKFYSKPYFLRLTLPGNVVEDGRETAKYDVDKGFFTITIPKETPGEHFDGLDMLTKLLAPAGSGTANEPVIEVINDTVAATECGTEQEEVYEDEEDIDWRVAQQPFNQDEMAIVGSSYYGFANRRTGVFTRLQDELCGIVDVPDPDHMPLLARREARQLVEQQKFDEDHYIADFMEDECIQSLLQFRMPWEGDLRKLGNTEVDKAKGADTLPKMNSNVTLTDDEREQMIKLPKKQYLRDDQSTEASVMLGLVDVVFAYCYDMRTTEGDHSVESSWTICKLSATLSWLDFFSSVDEVIAACFTRALCYPLYRHWQLNVRVLKDVIDIFHLGRTQLLKCLLEIHRMLSQDEPRYILNDLYIADYCVWIQSVSHDKIHSMAQSLDNKMNDIDKSIVTFKLENMEQQAVRLMDDSVEEQDGNDSTDSDDEEEEEGEEEEEEGEDSEEDSDDTNSDDSEDIDEENEPLKPVYQYGYPNILRKSESTIKEDSCVSKATIHEHGLLSTTKVSEGVCSCPVQGSQKSDSDVSPIDDISSAVASIALNSSEEFELGSSHRLVNKERDGAETEQQSSEICDMWKEPLIQEIPEVR